MANLTTLQAQLETLRQARGSGVLRVTDGPKTVEYRTMADLTAAIDQVAAEIAGLNAANGIRQPSRQMRTSVRKGT